LDRRTTPALSNTNRPFCHAVVVDPAGGDVGGGDEDAVGEAEVVGVVEPVQVTPLKANPVGTGFDEVHVPLNPISTELPVPTLPL
jgi:hypothetical protein